MKVMIQGDWRTGRVYLDGREIKPAHCRLAYCRRHSRFSWGSYGNGSTVLALAILLQFVRPWKALALCEAFKRDVVSQWPQTDFTARIGVGRWLTRRAAERSLAWAG